MILILSENREKIWNSLYLLFQDSLSIDSLFSKIFRFLELSKCYIEVLLLWMCFIDLTQTCSYYDSHFFKKYYVQWSLTCFNCTPKLFVAWTSPPGPRLYNYDNWKWSLWRTICWQEIKWYSSYTLITILQTSV